MRVRYGKREKYLGVLEMIPEIRKDLGLEVKKEIIIKIKVCGWIRTKEEDGNNEKSRPEKERIVGLLVAPGVGKP
jgi:hypothetical protein